MAQLVDPFVPSRKPTHPKIARPERVAPKSPVHGPSQPVGGGVGNEFVARPAHVRPVMPANKPVLDHLRPYRPNTQHSHVEAIGRPVVAAAPDISPAKQVALPHPANQPLHPPIHRDFTPPAKQQRRGMGVVKLVLAIIGGLTFGLLIQSQTAGEILIGIYAIVAIFVLKLESRFTFALALAALVGIMVISLLKPGQPLANNFAVYAFLLLAVGTVSLAIETRRGY